MNVQSSGSSLPGSNADVKQSVVPQEADHRLGSFPNEARLMLRKSLASGEGFANAEKVSKCDRKKLKSPIEGRIRESSLIIA